MREPALSTAAVTLPITTEAANASDDRTAEAARCILFFDGVCGLCSWSVDFVMARDRRELFQFAPLQGSPTVARVVCLRLGFGGPACRRPAISQVVRSGASAVATGVWLAVAWDVGLADPVAAQRPPLRSDRSQPLSSLRQARHLPHADSRRTIPVSAVSSPCEITGFATPTRSVSEAVFQEIRPPLVHTSGWCGSDNSFRVPQCPLLKV